MSNYKYNSCHDAFTLAEVLITLAIIGVVAALTIPTLVKNYQDRVNATKLKKTKAVTEQMFKNIMVSDGVEQLSKTSVWELIRDTSCSPHFVNCRKFFNTFKTYVKAELDTNQSTYAYLNTPNDTSLLMSGGFVLFDGTMLKGIDILPAANFKSETESMEIKRLGGSMYSCIGQLTIDVNGINGPNVMGRDMFYYWVSDEGKLFPYGGKDIALWTSREALNQNGNYWRNYTIACGTPDKKDTIEKTSKGLGCAARIEENDWKIDY